MNWEKIENTTVVVITIVGIITLCCEIFLLMGTIMNAPSEGMIMKFIVDTYPTILFHVIATIVVAVIIIIRNQK